MKSHKSSKSSLLPLLVLLAVPAIANEMNVLEGSPAEGLFSARLTVAPPCDLEDEEIVTGTIGSSGTYAACESVTSDAEITGPSVTVAFEASRLIVLDPGFSVGAGATFTANLDPALIGSDDAYAQVDSPQGEAVYAARFFVDPTELSLADADVFEHFGGFDQGGTAHFRLFVKIVSGQPNVYATARDDVGTVHSMEAMGEIQIPDGWHWIEVGWSSASAPGANNGSLYLCVDSLIGCSNLENLDTDEATIDLVRWGASASSVTAVGFMDLDDFVAMRRLLIGP